MALRRPDAISRLETDLPRIRADLHQLEQVLLNLISNAIDAQPGGGRIVISTSSEGEATAARVRLVVRDGGPGIPPEHLSRIFDPFFSTKGAGRGTGLGLAICKEIVVGHRGEIHIRSAPGKGTAVTILLPAVAAAPAAAGASGGGWPTPGIGEAAA